MRVIRAIILLVFANAIFVTGSLLSSDEAKAEVIFKQKFKHFTVRGKNARQLFRDFQRKSPVKGTNSNHAALGVAAIRFSREVKFLETDTSCKVDKANITANVVIHLPKWGNYRSADKATKKKWDKFVDMIREHELTHAKIAKDYAGRIHRKFESFRSRSTCAKLEDALTNAGNRLLASHDRAQQSFDRKEYRRLLRRKTPLIF